MPAQVTTRAQVNGYRFLIRRLEHALIRGDSRMIHDPMRGQIRALLVGVVISMLVAGAATILAFFKPAPDFGHSAIMTSKANGGLFVRIGDHLHPALNLASARLIAGKADPPQQVDDKFLNTVPLGPAVGIIGAPNSIDGGDDMSMSSWTVCDTTRRPSVDPQAGDSTIETTVLANDPALGNDIHSASPDKMILAASGDTTYLVYDGVRAPIDPDDPVLRGALRLDDGVVREMSPGLLNSFPMVEPITPIQIQGTGTATSYLPSMYPVGSMLRTVDSRGSHTYVVLQNGLQPVSEATADIIRYGNPRSPATTEPVSITPTVISAAPIVHSLPVEHYPATSPNFVRAESNEVVCMSWQRGVAAAEADGRLLIGHRLPMPSDAEPVRLASADGSGPRLDSVYVKPGTGEYVQATGDAPGSRASGQLFYVSDVGLRYQIDDIPTASALGVLGVRKPGENDVPQVAPWPVLSLLPAGPRLSQEAAMIAHDGMAADPGGAKIAAPAS
jgi:type VII secretion protein EccB